jgi:DNA adenine methylase
MRYSPLRYPGGKNKLSAFIANSCIENGINGHYVEPYSGGASIALFLLLEGIVHEITINDKDRSIYAFWYAVLNQTEQLCNLIERTEITIDEWKKQREIQVRKAQADLLELGFSTFFLNRTNRSGIINGGVIGGVDQSSDYSIGCRFNKVELIERIRKIASRKEDIRLHNEDALRLIELLQEEAEWPEENVLFYFDPPYYHKADSLYMHHYKIDDHQRVSERIKGIKAHWVVSYDNVPEITKLYSDYEKKEYVFNHTAHSIRPGKEVLFFSQTITIPRKDWNPVNFKAIRTKTGTVIKYKDPYSSKLLRWTELNRVCAPLLFE